jgi:hypothetical protein
MIQEVEIEGFKSIRHLRLECRRINLFIGPPNTGKSNLLESLGMFGLPYAPGKLRAFARCQTMMDLFHNQNVGSPVRVRADGYAWTLEYEPLVAPPFQIKASPVKLGQIETRVSFSCHYDFDTAFKGCGAFSPHLIPFRFYRFARLERFPGKWPDFLCPPHGENMLHLLLRREPLRERIAGIFAEHGLRLVLRPWEARIELQKEAEGRAIAYPYAMASEALRRLAFHLLAIETNEGGLLIFEEPEVHLHPHHVRFLGERIALDARNQYWISTHSAHFLLAVLEKAPQKDVAVFLTARQNGETWARPLGEEEIQGILDDGCGFLFDLERLMSESPQGQRARGPL